jgi:hypothetical protein
MNYSSQRKAPQSAPGVLMTRSGRTVIVVLSLCFQIPAAAQNTCGKVREIPGYSLQGDSAAFFVTPLGQVIGRPNMPVDEDDRVIVYVLTTIPEAQTLRVRRLSPFRMPGTINLAGLEGDMQIPPGDLWRPRVFCAFHWLTLRRVAERS